MSSLLRGIKEKVVKPRRHYVDVARHSAGSVLRAVVGEYTALVQEAERDTGRGILSTGLAVMQTLVLGFMLWVAIQEGVDGYLFKALSLGVLAGVGVPVTSVTAIGSGIGTVKGLRKQKTGKK